MSDDGKYRRLGGNGYFNPDFEKRLEEQRKGVTAPPPDARLDNVKQQEAETQFNAEKTLKEAFGKMLKVFDRRVLVENKTPEHINDERAVLLSLHSASKPVSHSDVGILVFKLFFAMRDRMNQLEYENQEIAKELVRLRNRVTTLESKLEQPKAEDLETKQPKAEESK